MATCKINGTLLYSDETPVVSALVYAVPAVSPAITSSGYSISPLPIQAVTTSTGYFELSLIQEAEFFVTINCLGYRQKIKVPALTSSGLFASSSLPVNNQPTEPVNPNW